MGDRLTMRAAVIKAVHYVDHAGSWLQLLVRQLPQHHASQHALPSLLVRRRIGDGAAAQVATATLVQQLRAGDHVLIYADAIGFCSRTGHLSLHSCSHIERLQEHTAPPRPSAPAWARPATRTTTQTDNTRS